MACARDNDMVEAALGLRHPVVPLSPGKVGKSFSLLTITLAIVGFLQVVFERSRILF